MLRGPKGERPLEDPVCLLVRLIQQKLIALGDTAELLSVISWIRAAEAWPRSAMVQVKAAIWSGSFSEFFKSCQNRE